MSYGQSVYLHFKEAPGRGHTGGSWDSRSKSWFSARLFLQGSRLGYILFAFFARALVRRTLYWWTGGIWGILADLEGGLQGDAQALGRTDLLWQLGCQIPVLIAGELFLRAEPGLNAP